MICYHDIFCSRLGTLYYPTLIFSRITMTSRGSKVEISVSLPLRCDAIVYHKPAKPAADSQLNSGRAIP